MTKTPAILDAKLPISAVVDQVCEQLLKANVVLQAEPGAGKSTGLPLALLQAGFEGKIILLEPRRLAAQNVAKRLASQLGEPLGKTVGLRMRGRTEVSGDTRLEVVTEGVLTRILQNDPMLDGVAVVIFDEFHERSLHADLGLALCLEVQQSLREDLRLLLMSATLDCDQLCAHLGVAQPIVCQVRQHPVEMIWLGESRDPLPQAMAKAALRALTEHSGDVLVFLPGVAEIEKTARLLESSRLGDDVELHRLHGGASSAAQRAATAAKGALRRLILSTSIAETSITIDGVCVVVDAGLERRSRVDAAGVDRLQTVTASQASATQRAGRAGRTQAGVCYRLWSKSGHSRRAERWQPEILRADLSALLLELGQWGVSDIDTLAWVDAPPVASIDRARELLQRLQLWADDGLSEDGRAAAKLPLHPRLARMLLWASARGTGSLACQLAALLEEQSRRQGADLSFQLRQSLKVRSQRAAQLQRLLPSQSSAETLPAAVLLAQAYPDRIARRRAGQEPRFLLSSGSGAVLHQNDSLAHSEYLVVAELGGAGDEARIFSALEITEQELQFWCKDLVDEVQHVDWDARSERVLAERQQRLGALVLQSKAMHDIDPELRATALMTGLRRAGLQCLDWTEDALEWRARVMRMRELAGQDSGFPLVDDEHLLATLETWLQPWLDNKTTLKSLAQINLLEVFNSMLDYAQQQKLDAWFPRRYTVPSGSQHKLRYACEGNPVLAVKLQEMFGCRENPSVAQGRLTLKVELLSSARRPVQITEDLANFWHNSYPAVKKDLAGRYPKHSWPDDPLNAEATARAKPRKQ